MLDSLKKLIAAAAIVALVAAPISTAQARSHQRGARMCRVKRGVKRALLVTTLLAVGALGSGCASLPGGKAITGPEQLQPHARVLQLEQGSQASVLRGALGQLATQSAYKQLDMRVLDFTLRHGNGGKKFGVGFPVKVQQLSDSDAVVANDSNRSAHSARQRSAGKPVTWALTGGGFVPKASFSLDIGEAGSIRFSGGRLLSYSMLAPYENGSGQLDRARRNMSLDMPLTDARLRSLPEGTEVTLIGKVTHGTRVRVGQGVGVSDLGTGAEITASYGATRRTANTDMVSVRIKRLDGNKINVQIHKLDARQVENRFGAHIGLDADLASALDLGGGLTDRALGLVTRKIDKKLQNYLRVAAQFGSTSLEQGTRVSSQTIDLGTGASNRVGLREHTSQNSSGSHVALGPFDLFRYLSSTTVRNGTLSTTAGDIVYARAELRDTSKPIWPVRRWTGKTSTDRELVSASYPNGSTTHYLHLRQQVRSDHHTSADDVRRVLSMAQLFGAQSSTPVAAQAMGKTNTVIDVYINDAGLRAFANATPLQLMQAFTSAYDTLDHPVTNRRAWRTAPWLDTTHASHSEAMTKLRAGYSNTDAGNARSRSYYRLTHRNFDKDAKAYNELQQLLTLQAKIKGETTPLGRATAYAVTQEQLGAQLGRSAAAVATLATPANVLVNEISITPEKGAKVTFVHEGTVADPQQRIDRIVADPSSLGAVGANLD